MDKSLKLLCFLKNHEIKKELIDLCTPTNYNFSWHGMFSFAKVLKASSCAILIGSLNVQEHFCKNKESKCNSITGKP